MNLLHQVKTQMRITHFLGISLVIFKTFLQLYLFRCFRITSKWLKDHCRKHGLYQTPHLNEVLYLQHQGMDLTLILIYKQRKNIVETKWGEKTCDFM